MARHHRAGLGKIARFASWLGEGRTAEAVEADLARYYSGQDLRDVWQTRGGPSRLTWRRLMNLVDRLPQESATHTLIRESLTPEQRAAIEATPAAGYGQWSHLDLLLATVIDKLGWVIHAVYASQGGKPSDPKPHPRPGVARAEDRRPDPRAFEYLQRLRDAPRAS